MVGGCEINLDIYLLLQIHRGAILCGKFRPKGFSSRNFLLKYKYYFELAETGNIVNISVVTVKHSIANTYVKKRTKTANLV